MPVYLYWGEDAFRLNRAVNTLRDHVLDPNWASFNYDKIAADQPDAVIQGLNQAMSPTFGAGDRLVWLTNVTWQPYSEELLVELQRTLASLPATSHLLLTTQARPDSRSKLTKLLQQHAEIREFSPIAPWKTEQLVQEVKQAARQVGVRLTTDAIELLAESVGNDTRRLFCELEKLQLFSLGRSLGSTPDSASLVVNAETVATLVSVTTQSSLQLADAIRHGETAQALTLVANLISHNEPALRIVATLVRQFRTWLWVKLMIEAGERDERTIARAAQVSNPKRVYFLQQEVQQVSADQLQQALPLLLELEVSLKRGTEAIVALESKVVELCQLYH